MPVRLLPNQVPAVWDSIKYAVNSVESIPENQKDRYFNKLLASLLNDQAQCFVRVDNDRQLQALALTKIIKDEFTDERELSIECLYSFSQADNETWKADAEFIRQFAKSRECVRVVTRSGVKRIFDLMQVIGFIERYRSYSSEV